MKCWLSLRPWTFLPSRSASSWPRAVPLVPGGQLSGVGGGTDRPHDQLGLAPNPRRIRAVVGRPTTTTVAVFSPSIETRWSREPVVRSGAWWTTRTERPARRNVSWPCYGRRIRPTLFSIRECLYAGCTSAATAAGLAVPDALRFGTCIDGLAAESAPAPRIDAYTTSERLVGLPPASMGRSSAQLPGHRRTHRPRSRPARADLTASGPAR